MRLRPHTHSERYGTVVGYCIAMLAVGLSAVITRLLWNIGDSAIFPLFFGAVVLAAWYGGFGPGLWATALSGVVTAFVLLPPHKTFKMARDDVLRLMVFTLVSVLTSSLHAATRRAREHEHNARRLAEEAAAAKTRFLAMVSHELRNPLNPVMLLASAMEHDPALPETAREDLRAIQRNIGLEVRLINDLLDLSRVSSGKLRLDIKELDLKQPVQSALRVCADDLAARHIDLRLERCDSEIRVRGDALRLEQVFWNLLRNAIKFTPQGGRITLHCDARDGQAMVEIRDTGIGIAPERLSAIFQAFEQGGPDVTARFGGLGLGLAICRALCEAHGGAISAASEGPGHGATFTVTLPLVRSVAAQSPPTHAPAAV